MGAKKATLSSIAIELLLFASLAYIDASGKGIGLIGPSEFVFGGGSSPRLKPSGLEGIRVEEPSGGSESISILLAAI